MNGMQNLPPSPFHTELFNYLLVAVEKKMQDEGLAQEKEFAEYKTILEGASKAKQNHSFVDILENYQRLFSGKRNLPIEKKMLEAFSSLEFPLKISRGLPRLYKKDNPSISHIKQEFSNLPALKLLGLERFLLPVYDNIPIPTDAKICIFTYMLSDGWGDLVTHKEIISILKNKFPSFTIQSIICIPKRFSIKDCNLDPSAIAIPYDKLCSPSLFPEKAIRNMQASDLILSIPTFYPHTEELKKILTKQKKSKAGPHLLSIGQYGFIESEWFHPRSSNYSMGLHFLEKGILIREKTEKGDFRSLENQTLLFALFGTVTPQTTEIEAYLASHKFYLAYLVSPIGGATYLHALLDYEMKNEKTIDICSPSLGWLIEYINMQQRMNKPILTRDFGIQEIEIHFGGKIHRRVLASSGKKVRILSPGPLSDGDFRKAITLSEEFVAVRGDQSFSEAVSVGKLYFYDGAPHSRYFVKDLLALAENRLRNHKSALTLYRCMGQAFLYNMTNEPNDWVEETYFQEKEPWENIAKTLSLTLQARGTLSACKQLNQTIKSEYSFNKTICQMVLRELFHRQKPENAEMEKGEILAFCQGKQPLKETLEKIKSLWSVP